MADVVGNVSHSGLGVMWPNLQHRLVLDSIVLAMVWYSLWKLFKESRDIYPSPLIRLLVRDGKSVQYFCERILIDSLAVLFYAVRFPNFLEILTSRPCRQACSTVLFLLYAGMDLSSTV